MTLTMKMMMASLSIWPRIEEDMILEASNMVDQGLEVANSAACVSCLAIRLCVDVSLSTKMCFHLVSES